MEKGYAAIPYNLDMRVIWANKALLDQAGAKVPTDWQSYLDAAAALKKNSVYGYGTGAGAGAYTGQHAIVCWMINNGGGLFDEQKQPNCVTPENIEAVNFVLEMVSKGYVDPASSTYTSDKRGDPVEEPRSSDIGYDTGGLADNVGGDVAKDLAVISPLTSPSGKKGALYFPNNIMMYKNNPSIKGTRGFSHLLLPEHGAALDREHRHRTAAAQVDQQDPGVPGRQEQGQDHRGVAAHSKTWAAPGGEANFLNVTTVDATPAMNVFTQSILRRKTDAKSALTKLQDEIKANMKS